MRFSKSCKLQKVLLKGSKSHHALTNARLDGSRLLSCNGKALAVVPVERDEEDIDGPVSQEALKAATKGPAKVQASIVANGALKVDGISFPRPEETGVFPRVDAIIPDPDSLPYSVTLNAKMLYELAQAIGTEQVTLRFATATEGDQIGSVITALKVEPDPQSDGGTNGAFGIIMPCTFR